MTFRLKTTIVLMLVAIPLFGQRFSLEPGLGIGNVLELKNNAGKGMIFLGGYYLKKKIHLGFELGTSGNLFPIDTESSDGPTSILAPESVKSNTMMIKGRYLIPKGSSNFFLGLALGSNTYLMHVHAVDKKTVREVNFGIMPEVGVIILGDAAVSFRYLIPGTTPAFEGTSANGGNPVSLSSERLSILYLSASYRFRFGRDRQ